MAILSSAANEKVEANNEQADEGEAKEENKENKTETETTNNKKSTIEPEAVIDLASEDKEKEPRALHKTSSIFLRNLAPTITKAEVEAVSCTTLLINLLKEIKILNVLVEQSTYFFFTFNISVNIHNINRAY